MPTHNAGAGRLPTNLADADSDDHLAQHGYVVLPGGLGRGGVADLAALFRGVVAEVGQDDSGRFMPSMMIERPDLRARLWDGVRAITAPVVGPSFLPATTEVFGGSFVSKPASPNSVREPHQDPTVFDETTYPSLSVWIPLTESTADNGTLRVLVGSHRMGNHVRPPDVDSFDQEVRDIALRESVTVELEAGQLLVLDGQVIHDSPPNRSAGERVAAICALRSVGASMRMVRSEGGANEGTAEVYEVDTEVYRSQSLIAPDLSRARLVGHSPYAPASRADLEGSRAGEHRSAASDRSR